MATIKGCLRSCDGVQNYSTIPQHDSRKDHTFDDTVHLITNSPYPIPYTFRIPAPSLQVSKLQALPHTARAPPFCLQLDHTLAVLWCLFREKANKPVAKVCELGVGQLQWALYFLKGIKPPNGGDRAEDVSIAIQAIEDALLDLYADMSHLVMHTPEDLMAAANQSQLDNSCGTCCVSKWSKPIPPTEWVPSPSVGLCGKCTSITMGSFKGEGKARKSNRKELKTDKSDIMMNSIKSPCSYTFGTPLASSSMYEPGTGQDRTLQNPQLTQEILQLKMIACELSKRAPTPTDVSQITMLQEWRKEQVNRVEEELQRLKSLDNALGISSNAADTLTNFRNLKTTPAANTAESSVMNMDLNSPFIPMTSPSLRNSLELSFKRKK